MIAAANEAGGRDNITVVLFRLEEIEGATAAAGETAAAATAETTVEATALSDDDEYEDYGPRGGAAGLAGGSMRPETERAPRKAAARPLEPLAQPAGEAPAQQPRRRKILVRLGIVAFISGVLGVSAWIATRAVFFVGDRRTTAPSPSSAACPTTSPLGVELYSTHYDIRGHDRSGPERRAARPSPITSCARSRMPRTS